MKLKTIISITCCLFSGFLFAQQSDSLMIPKPSPVKLLLGFSAEFGGDAVNTVIFTNGETQNVNAGQGVSAYVGGQLRLSADEKLQLRSSLGYKYVTTAADNAHIRLTRILFNNTFNYFPIKQLRFAVGIATHHAVRFNGGGLGPNYNLKANVGPLFEVSYSGIGLSYTVMKYTDPGQNSYSANAIGLSFSGVLSGKRK